MSSPSCTFSVIASSLWPQPSTAQICLYNLRIDCCCVRLQVHSGDHRCQQSACAPAEHLLLLLSGVVNS